MQEREIRSHLSLEERAKRGEYRHLLAIALNQARQYDGTEESYNLLTSSLIDLENALPNLSTAETRAAQEEDAALNFSERNPREINDVLTIAIDAQKRALAFERERHPYVYEQYAGLFLPPQTDAAEPIVPGDGKSVEIKFDDRINEFINLLRNNKIFADDIIITRGADPAPSMMRQESYVKIEIPRIGKTVLICNQVGEATFIVQGHVPNETLAHLNKEELLTDPNYPARRVIRGEAWETQLSDYLFNEGAWGEEHKRPPRKQKVNVQDLFSTRETIRKAIKAKYTPETWVAMGGDKSKHPHEEGKAITAIRTIFGVNGDPYLTIPRLQLGLAIWPDDPTIKNAITLENRTTTEWRQAIEAAGWTPEKWVDPSENVLKNFKPINKRSLVGLGAIFGIDFSQRNINCCYQLGLAIWPGDLAIERAIAIENRTPEQWREAIEAAGWTPEKWLEMKLDKENKFPPIDGKGLVALGNIFSINGNPQLLFPRLELGLAIWPGSHVIERAITIEKRTPEQWREAIEAAGWTPEKWLEIKGEAMKKFQPIDDRGLIGLGKIFGISGKPLLLIPRLELGLAIWRNDPTITQALAIEKRTPEQWREAIEAAGWTPEKWVNLNFTTSYRLSVDKKGIRAIGGVFNIIGDTTNTIPRLQLGLKIWPDNPVLLAALTKANAEA